jgi:hypothetical protein
MHESGWHVVRERFSLVKIRIGFSFENDGACIDANSQGASRELQGGFSGRPAIIYTRLRSNLGETLAGPDTAESEGLLFQERQKKPPEHSSITDVSSPRSTQTDPACKLCIVGNPDF